MNWLVVWLPFLEFSHSVGILIIPIDELIFFRGVALAHQPVNHAHRWIIDELVGGLVAIFGIFPYIGILIIPIDFHIFQNTNQERLECFSWSGQCDFRGLQWYRQVAGCFGAVVQLVTGWRAETGYFFFVANIFCLKEILLEMSGECYFLKDVLLKMNR